MSTKQAKCALAAGLLLAVMAPVASANSPVHDGVREVHVSYTDLDLSAAEGLAALQARIARAARNACGNVDNRDTERRREWRSCVDSAVADAARQVESALFAARL